MKLLLLIITAFHFQATHGQQQELYSATGKASFYGKKFEGRKTASGEKFSNKLLTAAHLKLPFGTNVKVTNLVNNKSVVVRINDRGPYIKGRIIDLSQAAADSLDFKHSGWVNVKVEELAKEVIDTPIAAAPIPLYDSTLLKFPDDWFGIWKGDLKVYDALGLQQLVPMQLSISLTDTPKLFKWELAYNDAPRAYRMQVLDSTGSVLMLHEGSGIDLVSRKLGNTIITRFIMQSDKVLQDCDFTLVNKNEIVLKIFAGSENPVAATGFAVFNNDSVPTVKVLNTDYLQTATLRRSEK